MITLYTTGCNQCNVLKQKLDKKKIQYNIVCDVDEMVSMGIKAAPILEIDGKQMPFMEAIQWVNNQPEQD